MYFYKAILHKVRSAQIDLGGYDGLLTQLSDLAQTTWVNYYKTKA